MTVTTLRVGEERVDVVARATPAERAALDGIEDLTIASRDGVATPVGQVAKVIRTTEEPIIWRKDREVVVTAVADVVDGVQPPDVSRSLWTAACGDPRLAAAGIRASKWAARSRNRRRAPVRSSCSFPIMILVMLTLLMIQMQSFSRLVDGVLHRAARHRRRLDRAQSLGAAVRLRRAAWASSRSPAWTCATP